jgi:RimJ/RimL family protein N-acetyltransferase
MSAGENIAENNLKLREVQDGDLETLYEFQRDPETVRMSAFPAREYDAHMAHWAKVRTNPENLLYVITANDEVVGSIMSWKQEGQREIGYGIGRAYWGHGIATQALRLLLGIVLERPLFAYTAEHNIGSMRVLEKCGFVRAGETKGVLSLDGELVTEVFFRLG